MDKSLVIAICTAAIVGGLGLFGIFWILGGPFVKREPAAHASKNKTPPGVAAHFRKRVAIKPEIHRSQLSVASRIEDLSPQERQEELLARQKQISEIYSLMIQLPDKFGVVSSSDLHSQMSSFYGINDVCKDAS